MILEAAYVVLFVFNVLKVLGNIYRCEEETLGEICCRNQRYNKRRKKGLALCFLKIMAEDSTGSDAFV